MEILDEAGKFFLEIDTSFCISLLVYLNLLVSASRS